MRVVLNLWPPFFGGGDTGDAAGCGLARGGRGDEAEAVEPELCRDALWWIAVLDGGSVLYGDADRESGERVHCVGQEREHPFSEAGARDGTGGVPVKRGADRRDQRGAAEGREDRKGIWGGSQRHGW